MPLRICLSAILTICLCCGQQPIRITDAGNGEVIPLALVLSPALHQGAYTDLSGIILWKYSLPDSLQIRCAGYNPQKLWVVQSKDTLDIRLDPSPDLDPVIITGKENPAIRIIREVIANRKNHFPVNNAPYSATIYSKLRMDIPQSGSQLRPDTSRFFYAMLWESLIREEQLDAGHRKSTILDGKLSGVQGRQFPLSPTDLQDISLYRDVFMVLGQPFTSPVSGEAIGRYLYELGYVHISQTDTLFEIKFWPEKFNFNALQGRLYVNSNGYAIQGIEASLVCIQARPILQEGAIRQYFTCSGDSKWIPSQLFSRISVWLPGGTVDSIVLDARSDYLSFLPYCNVPKSEFDGVTIFEERHPIALLDSLRPVLLEPAETLTYQMIDSMLQKVPMEKLMDQTMYLQRGFFRIGPLMAPVEHLLTFNQIEEARFGAGLYISPESGRRFVLGGWTGYGVRDRAWKYGAVGGVWLNRIQTGWWLVGISHDLVETGNDRPEAALGSPFRFSQPAELLYRSYFLERMHLEHRYFSDVRLPLLTRLWIGFNASFTQFSPCYNYQYRTSISSVSLPEIGVSVFWRPLVSFMDIRPLPVVNSSNTHEIMFRFRKGVSVGGHGLLYSCIDGAWSSVFDIRRSRLLIRASAGLYSGDLPLYRLMIFRGNNTGRRNVTEVAAFDVMGLTEFAADHFLTGHIAWQPRWQLGVFRNWSPRVTIMGDMAYGTLSTPLAHQGVNLVAPSTVYIETGFGITHLFPDVHRGQMLRFMQFIGFSVHARMGGYAYPQLKQNLVFRIYTDLGRL